MKHRVLAAFLASLMFCSTLASCAAGEEDPTVDTEIPTNAATDAVSDAIVTEPLETEVEDDLPDDLYFDGDEVVIYSRYLEGWTSGEISAERIMGDRVNDTVYERNQFVEERLGVKFTSVEEDNPDANFVVNKVATLVKAGTHEYDILAAACYTAVNESLNGTFVDLRQTEYIDFDKPWWSQGFNEVVEYKGSQFGATGSMLLSLYRFSFATVFNKDLFTDAGVPFLYDDVRNGTWTLDRQIELVPIFHVDNGNGAQDEDGDIYGFISNNYLSVDPYWSSCMVDIIKKDEEGNYISVFQSAKLHDVCEKLLQLYYETNKGTFVCETVGFNEEQDTIRDMFADGLGAMATVRIMGLEAASIRDMKQAFGVVPMPKYDTAQEGYRTLMHDQFTILTIPTTAGEERTNDLSAVLEAWGSISYKTLRPAYYETTLRTKIAQDPESAEMLDVVIDNIYIDAGIIYTIPLKSFHDTFRHIMMEKSNTVTSKYKSAGANLTRRALPKMIEKLENMSAGN